MKKDEEGLVVERNAQGIRTQQRLNVILKTPSVLKQLRRDLKLD